MLWAEWLITGAGVIISLLVIRGFLPIFMMIRNRDVVWYMSAGVFFVLSSMAGRSSYWSYVPKMVRDHVGKDEANLIFGLVYLAGMYCWLKLQWLIIPEVDRKDYTIWNAYRFPHNKEWRLLIALRIFRLRKP